MLPSQRKTKKIRTVAPFDSEFIPTVDQAIHAAELVGRAREKLEPLGKLPLTAHHKQMHDVLFKNELGALEGLGAHLRIASVGFEGNSLSPAAMNEFIATGTEAMEKIENSQLNYTIMLSLFMTILFTLMVLHAGGPAYALSDESKDALHADIFGGGESSALSDLAGFAWPGDAASDVASRQSMRRALYIGDVVTLAMGLITCLMGLLNALMSYYAYGPGLPSVAAKAEFLIENAAYLMYTQYYIDAQLVFLPLSVAFVTARASAATSIANLAVTVTFLRFASWTGTRGSCMAIMRQQHREAHRLFAREERRAEAARSAPAAVTAARVAGVRGLLTHGHRYTAYQK